jgi:hypothetical protein
MKSLNRLAAAGVLLGAFGALTGMRPSAPILSPANRGCRVVMRPGPLTFTAGVRLVHEGNPYPDSSYVQEYRERSDGWELDPQPLVSLPQHLLWTTTERGLDVESEELAEIAPTAYLGRDGAYEWSQAVHGRTEEPWEIRFDDLDCATAGPRLDAAWDARLASYAQAIQAHLSAYASVRLKAYRAGYARTQEFAITDVQVRCFRPGGLGQIQDLSAHAHDGLIELGAPWDTVGCRATIQVDLTLGLGYEEAAL